MERYESLEHISRSVEGLKDYQPVAFTFNEEGTYEATTSEHFNWADYVPGIAALLAPTALRAKNTQSIKHLYNSLGEWRVKQISDRYGLDVAYKYSHGLPLTVRDIKVIFAGTGDIRIDDIRRIFHDIVEHQFDYLLLSDLEKSIVYKHFKQKTFSELRKSDFEFLYQVAVPFRDINTMFCHSVPELNHLNNPEFGSDPVEQMQKRVYILEEMRHATGSSELARTVRKVKNVFNYFMPEGTVIPHDDGYTYVFRMINERGCYKIFHKSMNLLDCPSIITNLGTQITNPNVPKSWETVYLDLHPNLGAEGAIATYSETRDLLTRPELGFVESKGERIDLTGHSLGGALAFFDMCLYMNQVRKVTTVASAGLDDKTLTEMAKRVKTLSNKISIHMIWDFEDIVRLMGDGHPGMIDIHENASIRVDYIVPKKLAKEASQLENPERPDSQKEAAQKIWHAIFNGPHLRESTADEFREISDKKYKVITLTNDRSADRELLKRLLDNRPKGWENLRKEFFGWIGRPDAFYSFWVSLKT